MPAGVMGKIELPNFPHTPPANLTALLLLSSIFIHTLTFLILVQQHTTQLQMLQKVEYG